MRNFIADVSLAICFSAWLLLSSCATAPAPSQSKTDQVIAKTIEILSKPSTQTAIENMLVKAGSLALTNATSPEDRKEIADAMWASSVLFNTMATGEVITEDQIANVMRQASPGLKTEAYTQYIDAVNIVWQVVYSDLAFINQPSLAKTYILIVSRAAQRVAAGSTLNNPS